RGALRRCALGRAALRRDRPGWDRGCPAARGRVLAAVDDEALAAGGARLPLLLELGHEPAERLLLVLRDEHLPDRRADLLQALLGAGRDVGHAEDVVAELRLDRPVQPALSRRGDV